MINFSYINIPGDFIFWNSTARHTLNEQGYLVYHGFISRKYHVLMKKKEQRRNVYGKSRRGSQNLAE